MHAHVYEEPVPLGELRTEVPAALGTLVRRLPAERPEDRLAWPDAAISERDATRMYADVLARPLKTPTAA